MLAFHWQGELPERRIARRELLEKLLEKSGASRPFEALLLIAALLALAN